MSRCKPHGRYNCWDAKCKKPVSSGSTYTGSYGSDLTNPASPLYQATFGSADTSSSGGYDSGSSSCDSGSY